VPHPPANVYYCSVYRNDAPTFFGALLNNKQKQPIPLLTGWRTGAHRAMKSEDGVRPFDQLTL